MGVSVVVAEETSRAAPAEQRKKEIPELDGVRALAIVLVFWYHAGIVDRQIRPPSLIKPVSDISFWGVYLFFVLSGFLLFLPYARAIVAYAPWPSARRFYVRRARRILPLYYLILICMLGGFIAFGILTDLSNLVFPFTAMFFLFHDMVPSAWHLVEVLDGPLWSLAPEWQFYLILPWIALALARFARGGRGATPCRRVALGLIALMCFGLGVRVLAAVAHYAGGIGDPLSMSGIAGVVFTLLFGMKGKYLEVFALGMAASLLYVAGVENRRMSARVQRRVGLAASLVAPLCVLVCVAWGLWDGRLSPVRAYDLSIWPSSAAWAVFGAFVLGLGGCALVVAGLIGPAPVRAVLRWRPLRFVGIISYSVYVWHYPILLFVSRALDAHDTGDYVRLVLIAALASLVIGSLSYWYVERPLLRAAPASRRRRRAWRTEVSLAHRES